MKTNCAIIVVVLLILFTNNAYPQDMRELTLEVNFIDKEATYQTKHVVYLVYNDSILEKSSVSSDGLVSFQIEGDQQIQELFIIIRQDENSIARIRLEDLSHYQGFVDLPKMRIKFMSYKSIEKKSRFAIPVADRRFYSLAARQPCLNTSDQDYFPIEKLMYSSAYYKKRQDKYINRGPFKDRYGRCPTDKEIDSLIERIAYDEALERANWCDVRFSILNEPVLHDGNNKVLYRFSWSSNKADHLYVPYSFRIELDEGANAIMYCSYVLWDECDEDLVYHDVMLLDKTSFDSLSMMVGRADIIHNTPLLDGGGLSYILETCKDGQYYVVFRGLDEDQSVEELQQFLWKLSGLKENKIVHRKLHIE